MDNPTNVEAQVLTINLARCEDKEPCVGCGRPTHTAVVVGDGQHHVHVCSPMCFAIIEVATRIVEAAQQGEHAPHMMAAAVPHPRKEQMN